MTNQTNNTNALKAGDVVRFREPMDESERDSRMIILEDRDTRMLVVDCRFVNNPDWPIRPTSVYATSDLEVEPIVSKN